MKHLDEIPNGYLGDETRMGDGRIEQTGLYMTLWKDRCQKGVIVRRDF